MIPSVRISSVICNNSVHCRRMRGIFKQINSFDKIGPANRSIPMVWWVAHHLQCFVTPTDARHAGRASASEPRLWQSVMLSTSSSPHDHSSRIDRKRRTSCSKRSRALLDVDPQHRRHHTLSRILQQDPQTHRCRVPPDTPSACNSLALTTHG